MSPLTSLFAVCLLLLSASHYTFASQGNPVTYLSPKQLNQIVLSHLKQKVDQKLDSPKIKITPISKRIRLAQCQTGIELTDQSPSKIAGRMTIKLSCQKPSWKIHITATVNGNLPVIVSKNGILKKMLIKPSDVEMIYLPYKKVKKGTMQTLDKVVGMRTKRSIGPHKIISIHYLQPPYLVFKNQPINIIFYMGNLKVESSGTALKSGTKDQQISFKNNASNKVLKGIVVAPNTVWVP